MSSSPSRSVKAEIEFTSVLATYTQHIKYEELRHLFFLLRANVWGDSVLYRGPVI